MNVMEESCSAAATAHYTEAKGIDNLDLETWSGVEPNSLTSRGGGRELSDSGLLS